MTTDVPQTEVSIRRDVVFDRVDGYRPLALDLYEPASPPVAVCMYLHGGGWRRGSRREGPGPLSPTSSRSFVRLAERGIAVASIDYRLSGEATFPAQLHDIASACRWVRQQVTFAGVPLVFFGVSAGGNMAALAGLDASVGAKAVVAWYAATDLLALPDDLAEVGGDDDRGPDSREALLLGARVFDVPDLARAASPVALVRADAPPFLLLHGDADVLVPIRQSVRLHEALIEAGGSSVFEVVPGYNHMFRDMPDADIDALIDRTATFLLDAVGG
jgi:acetyl esterase/lipase